MKIFKYLVIFLSLSVGSANSQFNNCQLGGLGGFCGGSGSPITPSILVDFTTNSATVSGVSTPITNLFSITRADSEPTLDNSGTWGSVGANTLAYTNRGLQIYAGATNLMLQSQAITNATWTGAGGNGMTNTDNAVVAPDGTTTAATAASTGVNGTHFFQQLNTLTTGTVYTTSFYVKKGTGAAQFLQMFWGGGTPDLYVACIDTSTGQTFALTGRGYIRARSETLANGWFRFIVTYKVGGSQTAIGFALVPALNSSRALTSTLTGNLQVWGFQHETGFSATPYIPTTTTTVARASDQISISGALATAIAASSGTLVVETGSADDALSSTIIDSNGTTLLGKTAKNGVTSALGSILYSKTVTNWSGAINTVALGWDGSGGIIQVANGTQGTDTVSRSPVGTFYLGSTSGSSSFWNGIIRKITFYPAKTYFGISNSTPFRSFDGMAQYVSNPIIPFNTNAYNTVAADAPYFNTTQNINGTYYALTQGNTGPGSTWKNITVYSTSDFQSWSFVGLGWTATASAWDDHYLGHPAIIKIGSTWNAYYSGMNSAGTTENIGLATSTDFINWTKYSGNPVITGANVAIPSVVKIGNQYVMYVSQRTSINITYYTSPDGITWTLGGTALSVGSNSWFGGVTQMNDPYVVYNGTYYEMTFTAGWTNGTWPTPYTIQSIGYATSSDGFSWIVLQAPILQGDGVPGSYNQNYPGDSLLFFNSNNVWLYYAGVNGSSVAQGALGKLQ